MQVHQTRRWTPWETGALLLYVATVALGLRWHEGWADEAQAWMLARDSGWWQLIWHRVRYEGSPGLWHSLLWVLARLHFSYIGMHYAAALFALAGVAVLLRWAPFPRFLKLLIPFGFFLAYQDAVVARSYVLFSVLAFGAAALLRSPKPRPLVLGAVLALMANMSAHGCVASAALGLVAANQARQRGLLRDRLHRAGVAFVLLGWLIAVATAWPPHDMDFPEQTNLHKAKKWVADRSEPGGGHWFYLNDQNPAISPAPNQPYVVTRKDALVSATMKQGELAPIPVQRAHLPLRNRLQRKVGRWLGVITFPLSTSRSLAITVVMLFVLSVRAQSMQPDSFGWWALVPWALPVLVFMRLYIAPRHAGILLTLFVVSLWLAWGELEEGRTHRVTWLQGGLCTALLLMFVQQIGWTKDAILADKDFPYSGDWTTAKFLQNARKDGPIAGFYYHASGALGFLPGWHYSNQPNSYWLWSTYLRTNQRAPEVLKQHPAYVVVGGFTWGPEGDVAVDWADPYEGLPMVPAADNYRIASFFKEHGYIETHRLCGRLLMRDGFSEEECNVILEPFVPED